MSKIADLEIGLHRRSPEAYAVEFRFSQPDSDVDIRLGQGNVQFNFQTLTQLLPNQPEYGQALTKSLFAESAVQSAFAQALTNTQTLDIPLRIRLFIGPSAPELHGLYWETLRNPQDDTPLATNENILFSRYLGSLDWRTAQLRRKDQLKALVAVANPSNLGDYRLAEIDVEAEIGRARQSLGAIPVTTLPAADTETPVTIDQIFTLLRGDSYRDGSFDLLYLVCHGHLGDGTPWLWLENDEGKVARVSGDELVMRFKELERQPRLIVLASCESAGDGTGKALSALGPKLAEAGIPAVLAMQGKISIKTVDQFMPVFFQTLEQEGEVDRALTVARGLVRQRPDHWMPALFMRLKSGRIWYTPGFGGDKDDFEIWESLKTFIQEGICTPIVGPGLTEPLLGSRRDIALRWADKHGYPLAEYEKEDMPRVAQFVVTRQNPTYLRIAYREAVRDEVLHRYAEVIPEKVRQQEKWSAETTLQTLNDVADAYWADSDTNPHKVLAKMKLPIYITADHTDLLARALRQAGADPQVRYCPWNNMIPKSKCIFEDDPTPEKPLVYHLFGHIQEPFSLVITEDEFFDYLIGVTVNKALIPSAVRAAMTSTALIFLGFRMTDWNFRVFFRMVMAQEGRERLSLFSHAAAQIEPEEGHVQDVERARRYLKKYFEIEKISLYWGSSADFLKDLRNYIASG